MLLQGSTYDSLAPVLLNYYLPDIRWFSAFKHGQTRCIWFNPPYQRQCLFSRAYVFSKGQPHRLSIPVSLQQGMDPFPDYSQSWVRIHKGALQSIYGKAPYFEYIAPLLFVILDDKNHTLWSLNKELILLILKICQLPSPVWVTTDTDQSHHQRIELVDVLKTAPIRPFTDNIAGMEFGNEFDRSLSAVHLMFHKGPESSNFL